MRIWELLEDLPTIQGLTPSINTSGLNTTLATNNANTANSFSMGTTANTNTGNSSMTTANTVPINQDILNTLGSKGTNIQVPEGPYKNIKNLKITGVDSSSNQVILTDPTKPTQPGIAYDKNTLAQILSQNQGK